MTIKEAVDRATNKGWKDKMHGFDCDVDTYDHILMDPDFWVSFGRSMGWKDLIQELGDTNSMFKKGWLFTWHQFINHIARGGEVEEFFEKL